jgi:ubiquinone/menaquinone biosynthesis C-methylase UbiE
MISKIIIRFIFFIIFALCSSHSFADEKAEQSKKYETRAEHDPNGIGKFYLGREIAHVMGHQAADWLERPTRVDEEKPDLMVQLLRLKSGDSVADIGAGTGYISWRLAKQTGPKGKIYAVEIQQEMLDLLSAKMKERGIENVIPVLGTITDPKLPESSIDLVLMVDVYHEFSHPYEMMQSIVKSLKPGGRVAWVEFRAEDPEVPIKAVHKMTENQVKKEAQAAGLEWQETISKLPWQHLIICRKPLEKRQTTAAP